MVLGNYFPDDIKNNYINKHPHIYDVYRYYNEIAEKTKLIIIIAEYKDNISHSFAYCFINSEINCNIYPPDSHICFK